MNSCPTRPRKLGLSLLILCIILSLSAFAEEDQPGVEPIFGRAYSCDVKTDEGSRGSCCESAEAAAELTEECGTWAAWYGADCYSRSEIQYEGNNRCFFGCTVVCPMHRVDDGWIGQTEAEQWM